MKDFRCGFSRKQINVIFASWKQGKINLTENQMKKLYEYADYYSYIFIFFSQNSIDNVRTMCYNLYRKLKKGGN